MTLFLFKFLCSVRGERKCKRKIFMRKHPQAKFNVIFFVNVSSVNLLTADPEPPKITWFLLSLNSTVLLFENFVQFGKLLLPNNGLSGLLQYETVFNLPKAPSLLYSKCRCSLLSGRIYLIFDVLCIMYVIY